MADFVCLNFNFSLRVHIVIFAIVTSNFCQFGCGFRHTIYVVNKNFDGLVDTKKRVKIKKVKFIYLSAFKVKTNTKYNFHLSAYSMTI